MNKISIIMAAYNAEKTIEKAIKSILNSDLKDYELIIIDDASVDNTKKIIESFNSPYIKLLCNKKNMGAGYSKNIGLDNATGKYIGFIDSDDYVAPNYYLNMLSLAEKANYDIVVSDIVLEYPDHKEFNDIFHNNIVKNKQFIENIEKNIIFGTWSCASTCSKLFNKNIINKIKFSQNKCDDVLFTTNALINSQKIGYCKNNNYYYVQTPNSLSRTNSYEKYNDGLNSLIKAIKLLYKSDYHCAQIYAANALLPHIFYSLNNLPFKDIEAILLNVQHCFEDKRFLSKIVNTNHYINNSLIYADIKYRKFINYLKKCQYNKIIDNYNYDYTIQKKYNRNYKSNDLFRPLVTIVIPVYNGENYIAEAIDSALAQTYKNIEILVVNDGSNDNTEKIVKSYGSKVRYIKKKNGGVASALNLAIKEMNGEYFSWLSHDDLYFKDKIKTQIDFLSNIKDKNTVLFSDYILINSNGRMIGEPVQINHKFTLSKEYCLLRGCINGITLLIPKVAFNKCGSFNEKLRCTQDYDMWLRMLKDYPFVHMKNILSKTRIHSLQDTVASPRAVSEGEILWQEMINSVSDQRKIELEGSLYNFYYKMALHLSVSAYPKTLQMCIDKCKEINPKRYSKKPAINNGKKTIYQKIIYCLDNYGLFGTVKVILKKLMRRL